MKTEAYNFYKKNYFKPKYTKTIRMVTEKRTTVEELYEKVDPEMKRSTYKGYSEMMYAGYWGGQ